MDDQKKKKDERTIDVCQCRLRREEFDKVVQVYQLGNYEPELPGREDTADQPPAGKIALYTEFFYWGNFRVPITRYMLKVFETFGLHVTQIHPLAMAKIRHFEFVCHCLAIEPSPPRLM